MSDCFGITRQDNAACLGFERGSSVESIGNEIFDSIKAESIRSEFGGDFIGVRLSRNNPLAVKITSLQNGLFPETANRCASPLCAIALPLLRVYDAAT